MLFLVPTPRIPCRFLPRAKVKVQTYRKKSMYFWLQSALKCILRFLLHRNRKSFGKHPVCKILSRFFSGSFAHNEKFQRVSSRRERKVKNTLQNNHNNTFFLALNRQRPWAKFRRGIKRNSWFFPGPFTYTSFFTLTVSWTALTFQHVINDVPVLSRCMQFPVNLYALQTIS